MRIGLYIKWPKGMWKSPGYNVIGDELYAESMKKYLEKYLEIKEVEIFAPNYLPNKKLDLMIYLNDNPPNINWAKKHFLYFQNAYGDGSYTTLQTIRKYDYHGYAFISNKLQKIHKEDGFDGIFLPFGVDIDFFYPREPQKQFAYEVGYIGNDIKGEYRSSKYLFPATKFKYGLYGNWLPPPSKSFFERLQFWGEERYPKYKKRFSKISKGKLSQEMVPFFYSSVKVNLNCTAQDCVDWDVITLRTYEVLACKGFLISDKVPIAEKLLQGSVIFTDGDEDLIEKISYYLTHDSEREKIAYSGYQYVINNASVEKRMHELMNYLMEII